MNTMRSCNVVGIVVCALAMVVPIADAAPPYTACCDTETYACTTRLKCNCQQGEECNPDHACYGYNGICRLPNGQCTDMDRACMPVFDCVIDPTCFSISDAEVPANAPVGEASELYEDARVCEADEPVCYPDDEIIAEPEGQDASNTG